MAYPASEYGEIAPHFPMEMGNRDMALRVREWRLLGYQSLRWRRYVFVCIRRGEGWAVRSCYCLSPQHGWARAVLRTNKLAHLWAKAEGRAVPI